MGVSHLARPLSLVIVSNSATEVVKTLHWDFRFITGEKQTVPVTCPLLYLPWLGSSASLDVLVDFVCQLEITRGRGLYQRGRGLS